MAPARSPFTNSGVRSLYRFGTWAASDYDRMTRSDRKNITESIGVYVYGVGMCVWCGYVCVWYRSICWLSLGPDTGCVHITVASIHNTSAPVGYWIDDSGTSGDYQHYEMFTCRMVKSTVQAGCGTLGNHAGTGYKAGRWWIVPGVADAVGSGNWQQVNKWWHVSPD